MQVTYRKEHENKTRYSIRIIHKIYKEKQKKLIEHKQKMKKSYTKMILFNKEMLMKLKRETAKIQYKCFIKTKSKYFSKIDIR